MHLDLCRLDGAGAAEAGVVLSADGRRLSEAGAGGSAAAADWFVTAHRRRYSMCGAAACYCVLVSSGVQLLLGAAGCWWCGGSGTLIDFSFARAR